MSGSVSTIALPPKKEEGGRQAPEVSGTTRCYAMSLPRFHPHLPGTTEFTSLEGGLQEP